MARGWLWWTRGPLPWARTAALLVCCLSATALGQSAALEPDTVVLLHGLSRTPRSMRPLARRLAAEGYRVLNLGYPSRRETVPELARQLAAELPQWAPAEGGQIHFVTHSMGGIVLRYCLAHYRVERLGRVVMLAPPNGGSELVDVLKQIPFVCRHLGPSRGQLGTDAQSVPNTLGPVTFDVGVIAGSRSWVPISSWILPGPDDGMVAVARTPVAGMRDFLVVPHTHTFMMRSEEVLEQTVLFLRHGAFRVANPAGTAGGNASRP